MRKSLRRRRELRRNSTDAETAIWYHLRDRRLEGFKFRRQHACGPYILDFFCQERLVAVELDGGQHFDVAAQQYDQRRTEFLEAHGITVLRFNNDQVMSERHAVLEAIARLLTAPHPAPAAPASPDGRGKI